MASNRSWRKNSDWLVVIFILIFQLARGDMPAAAKNQRKALAAKASQEIAADGPATSAAVERVGSAQAAAKRHGFPWLLVAAGAVAAGVVLYFTVFKKKPQYNLTITMDDGVTGNLPTGTKAYSKDTKVDYAFQPKDGFKKLAVTLDDMPVPASGTLNMDRDHNLAASASEGVDEQFNGPASSLWQPRNLSHWSVGGGNYICNATFGPIIWDYNVCNYRCSQEQFVLEVRQKNVQGDIAVLSGIGIFTSAGPLTHTSGFAFNISADGRFSIYKVSDFSMDTFSGSQTAIDSGSHSAIISGLGQWNVLRIARSGSGYTFSINGTVVKSFNDGSIDPRYLALLPVGWNGNNHWEYDYVVFTPGDSLMARGSLRH